MKTLMAATFMCVVAASTAFATAQYPDKIVYEGRECSLQTNPMNAFFAKNPDKKPKSGLMSSALWRGYVATFAFETNTLVLKDIEIQVCVEKEEGQFPSCEWKSVKNDVVPEGEDLPVDWFTGVLVLPHGKLVNYVHAGYGSTYSDYIILELEQGKITGKRTYDHVQYEKFKERHFQAFKGTEAYKERVAKLKKNGVPEESIDPFLQNSVVDYASEFLDEDESTSKPVAGDGK